MQNAIKSFDYYLLTTRTKNKTANTLNNRTKYYNIFNDKNNSNNNILLLNNKK